MAQLKIILNRLKNPSVILSIVSQIVTVLLLLKVNVDVNIVTGIVTAICSVFVILGIMSNPSTLKKSYGDDIYNCAQCNQKTRHVLVDGKLVCSNCGTQMEDEKE